MNSSFNACNGNDTKCVQMTPNDEAVLNAIFNPFEPTLIPSSEQFEDADDNNSNAQTPQLPEHLRKQELEAIQLAESGKID